MSDIETIREFFTTEGRKDWRVVAEGACAHFHTSSLAESARLVQAIGELPGIEDRRPDIDLRQDGVTVRLVTSTDTYFGPTVRDIEVARQVSAVAQELGLSADPSKIQSVLVIPGATNTAEVMPFWRAVLGYVPRPDSPDEDLVDPHGRGPALWFEQMEEARQDGGGSVHLSVWVPYEQVKDRIESALAAGGRMVRDDSAPSWWTLADPAGNEVCIATVGGRA
jgi:4a-hydroxytetrahydrobiopterin dehydratase